LVGNYRAGYAEVRVGVDRERPGTLTSPRRVPSNVALFQRERGSWAEHSNAAAAERAGECELAHSFRQRQHGGEHHGRRAADEDVHAKWLTGADAGRMVYAYRT